MYTLIWCLKCTRRISDCVIVTISYRLDTLSVSFELLHDVHLAGRFRVYGTIRTHFGKKVTVSFTFSGHIKNSHIVFIVF